MISGRLFIKVVTSMDAATATAIFVFFSINEVTAYSEHAFSKARWFESPDLGSTGFVRMPIPGSSSAISPESPEPVVEPEASTAAGSTAGAAPEVNADLANAAVEERIPADVDIIVAADEVATAADVASAPSAQAEQIAVPATPSSTAADATEQPAVVVATSAVVTVVAAEDSSTGDAGATAGLGRAANTNGEDSTRNLRRHLKRNRAVGAVVATAVHAE